MDKFIFPPQLGVIVKKYIRDILPTIRCEIKEENILDYYSKSYKEPKLINMYKTNFVAYPNTPNYNSKSHRKLQLLCDNKYIITMNSLLKEINRETGESKISKEKWSFNEADSEHCIHQYDDDNIRTKILYNDINKNNKNKDIIYNICTIISFCYNDKPTDNIYKFSIHIDTIFGPLYNFNDTHDNSVLRFYYEEASNPISKHMCMCYILNLGLHNCPFQEYLNKNSIKYNIDKLMELSFDIKDEMNSNNYLKLMNIINKIDKQIK